MESNSLLDSSYQKIEKKSWSKNTNVLSIIVPVCLSLILVVYLQFSVSEIGNINYVKSIIFASICLSVICSLIYSKDDLRTYKDCLYKSIISLIISLISASTLFTIIHFIRLLINAGFDTSLLRMYPIAGIYIFMFTLYVAVISFIPTIIGSLIGYIIQKKRFNSNNFRKR